MARPPMHGVRPRETLDKVVLGAAFVIGAGGSVALKLGGAPILLTALFPVAVLVAYVLACFLSDAVSIEPETVGDNCYYLGFLFTLASLGVTLFLIRDLALATAAPDVIPQVVSGFGVALSSTVMGVFLRVMLMQMRPDIVARDREARRELAQGARDFHLAITQVSRRLKDIAVETAQHGAERNARLDEISDGHAALTRELLATQAKALESVVAEAGARLAEEVVARLAADAERAAEALRLATERLARSVEQITAMQEAGLPRLAEAQRGVEAALAGWAAATTAQRAQSIESAELVAGEAKAMTAAAKSLQTTAQKAAQRLAEQSDAMAASVARGGQTIEEAAQRIGASSQESAERLAEQAEALGQAVEVSTLAIQLAVSRIAAASSPAPRVEEPAVVAPAVAPNTPPVPSTLEAAPEPPRAASWWANLGAGNRGTAT